MMRPVTFKSGGFSLIEIMVAIVIVGIVLAYSLPTYAIWIENSKIRNGAESILNGLQKARAAAVMNNAQVEFILGDNSAWTVGCVTPTATCPAQIEHRASVDGSSSGVTVTTTPASRTTITFSHLGIGVDTDEDEEFGRVDVDTTAILSDDSRNLRIVVSPSGSVRMCDPEFSLPDPKGC